MKHYILYIILSFSLLPVVSIAQTDTLINKLDSLARKSDSAGGQVNNISEHAYDKDTRLNITSYFQLLGSDLKQQFTKPFHMKKKDWSNFGKYLIVVGAAAFADKPVQKFSVAFMSRNPTFRKTSQFITNFGGLYEMASLAAFGSYGLLAKRPKVVTTTLLATQAYAIGSIMENVVKFISGRTRPSYYPSNVEARPRFLGPFVKIGHDAEGNKSYSGFPSGHTTVAFAAATVFALEYSDRPAVPIIAYSYATIVGLSRISENKHWLTDVISGAALGFLSGRNVVNNYHRYAKLRSPQTKKNNPVSFDLHYNFDHIEPALVYKIQ